MKNSCITGILSVSANAMQGVVSYHYYMPRLSSTTWQN